MRIGIYNRWLATLGGGEKYGLAVAEYLSRHHSVEVITHKPVSKDLAERRLNLDLLRVEFRIVSDRPSVALTPLTAEYDFFINASFLDVFPSRARFGAMIVFFPMPLKVEREIRFRRWAGLVLKHWLMVPSFEDGVLSTQVVNGSQRRQTTAQVNIKLPPSTLDYALSFELAPCEANVRRAVVALDGRTLEMVDLVQGKCAHCRVAVPGSREALRTLTIRSETSEEASGNSPVSMTLTHFEIEHPRYYLYHLLFERWLKERGLKLHRIPSHIVPLLESVKTYNDIWAISKFTQNWIKRYWNLTSKVLYPPIDVEQFRPERKQNRILSVGRFFVGSHNKKHREMMGVFKKMVDQGLQGWELHLAGGTTPGEVHRKYLEDIYTDARGYPIVIHPDIQSDDLKALYGTSSIYWHASGYGENEESEPIKFEHFGITTVESMASGCVPVVINRGGQREVIRHGQNGFLWETLAELQAQTLVLITDSNLHRKLSDAAVQDSHRYDRFHFDSRLEALLEDLGLFR